jgi:heterodisulfide reductase subunit A-like polyferredoxin
MGRATALPQREGVTTAPPNVAQTQNRRDGFVRDRAPRGRAAEVNHDGTVRAGTAQRPRRKQRETHDASAATIARRARGERRATRRVIRRHDRGWGQCRDDSAPSPTKTGSSAALRRVAGR